MTTHMTVLDSLLDSSVESGPSGGGARRVPPDGPPPARRRWLPSRGGRPSFVHGAPIVGFTGPNGAGKTLVAVSCIINDDIRRGRPVYSTVPITSEWGDSQPVGSFGNLLQLRDCTVFLDEVAAIFSSRDSLAVPREFDVFLQSMRHKGITLRWTAPAWARADLRLREVTQVAVGVQPLGKRVEAGQFWPRPVTILAGALDATGVAVDSAPEKVSKRRIFVPELLAGWGAYDTLADTPRIGVPAGGGSCVDCGGTVAREKCTPDRHRMLDIPLTDLHRLEEVSPRATVRRR